MSNKDSDSWRLVSIDGKLIDVRVLRIRQIDELLHSLYKAKISLEKEKRWRKNTIALTPDDFDADDEANEGEMWGDG